VASNPGFIPLLLGRTSAPPCGKKRPAFHKLWRADLCRARLSDLARDGKPSGDQTTSTNIWEVYHAHPASQIFRAFVRATSKAKKATLLLFSVAVLLGGGGGARAIRARGFRSERERHGSRRGRATGRQDSYRRRLYNALAQRRSGGHAQPHCPAEPGRHARHRLRPEREQFCPFNRGAGGRQDFSGRRFQRSGQTRNRIGTLAGTGHRGVISGSAADNPPSGFRLAGS
jgi:hypothetical protein